MKNIENKLKEIGYESITISIVSLLLGFFMFLLPNTILDIISYLIGVGLILFGVLKIIYYFSSEGQYNIFNYNLSSGTILILLGIISIIFKTEITSIFRILIGIFVIYDGVIKLLLSARLTYANGKIGIYSFLLSILVVLCGCYILFNNGIIIASIGYVMIIFAVISLIENIIYIKNIKDLKRYFNEKNIK